jgi:hypothetical protein
MPQSDVSAKNRRRAMRRPPKRISKVACFKGALGLGPNLALEMLDLSERGIRMRVKEPLAPHQQVEIQLSGLSHRKPVKVAAEIVWCVPAADGSCCVGAHFARGLPYADFQLLT